MNWLRWLSPIALVSILLGPLEPARGAEPGVVLEEFLYEKAPFPECHASTIVETSEGLMVAWFGGTEERNPDVCIWVSRRNAQGWSAPERVADGIESETVRFPCWNPVLYQVPQGPLHLYYKVGPSPEAWWGMMISSTDGGRTWTAPQKLPPNILGPIKNKPIALADGRILHGTSDESDGWIAYLEFSDAAGTHWERSAPLNTKEQFGAIQPTILQYSDGKLQVLCRTREKVISECWSEDQGKTWSSMRATSLPNPNSGIDGVSLRDGRQLLVYNHSIRKGVFPAGREVMNVATSRDGESWNAVVRLENEKSGEFSYPAVIQTADGLVHITYTHLRTRIRHVVLDPAKLVERPIVAGAWPAN